MCVRARSFCRCFDEDIQTQILASLLRFFTRFGLSRLFASASPNLAGALLTFVFVCRCVCRARVFRFCRCFHKYLLQAQILASLLQYFTRFGHSRLFVISSSNVARLFLHLCVCVCTRSRVYSDFADVSTNTFFGLKCDRC